MKLFKFEKVMIHAVLITACLFFFLWIIRTIFIWFVHPVASTIFDSIDSAEEMYEVFEPATEVVAASEAAASSSGL